MVLWQNKRPAKTGLCSSSPCCTILELDRALKNSLVDPDSYQDEGPGGALAKLPS